MNIKTESKTNLYSFVTREDAKHNQRSHLVTDAYCVTREDAKHNQNSHLVTDAYCKDVVGAFTSHIKNQQPYRH